MNTLWHKLWADLWQDKARSWLAIASIAAGVFCVGTLFGMIDLQLSQMDEAHGKSQPSHINLILRQDADVSLLDQIKALPGVAGIDYMTQLTVRFRKPGNKDWQMGTYKWVCDDDSFQFTLPDMMLPPSVLPVMLELG